MDGVCPIEQFNMNESLYADFLANGAPNLRRPYQTLWNWP